MKKKYILALCALCSFITSTDICAQERVVELTTTKANGEKMTLMVNKTFQGVTVDWGDGNPVLYKDSDSPFHVIEGQVKGQNIIVSGHDSWDVLSCAGQNITNINLENAKELKSLYCQNNQLTKLDLRGMLQLKDLNCTNNNIEQFEFTNEVKPETDLPKLETYYIANNKYKGYTQGSDKNTFALRTSNLQQVDISGNGFEKGFFSSNTGLKSLNAANNALKDIKLSTSREIGTLITHNNKLATLTFANNNAAELVYLSCDNNQLKTINISGASELKDISCANNQLTTLTLSGDAKDIETINMSNNVLGINSLPSTNSDLRSIVFEPQKPFSIASAKGIVFKGDIPTIPVIESYADRNDNPLDLSSFLINSGGKRTDGKVTWFSIDDEGNTTQLVKGTGASNTQDYTESSGKFSFYVPFKRAYAEVKSTKYEVTVKTQLIAIGDDVSSIDGLILNSNKPSNIYDLSGKLVKKGASSLNGLPKGVYIVNGKKIVL